MRLLRLPLLLLLALAPASSSGATGDDRLVFVAKTRTSTAGAVALANGDGSAARIVLENGNIIGMEGASGADRSPDGSRIAFTSFPGGSKQQQNELYAIGSDGTGLVRLTENTATDTGPSWTPDGRIVFASSREYPANPARFDLWVMNADGSGARKLFAEASLPKVSPDGQRIAFSRGMSIYVSGFDGRNAKVLFRPCKGYAQPGGWSPDGTRIVFHYDSAGQFTREVYVMRADGSDVKRLTYNASEDSAATFSPDGAKIAFAHGGRIWTMSPDGSSQTDLGLSGGGPSWARATGRPAAPVPAGGTPPQTSCYSADAAPTSPPPAAQPPAPDREPPTITITTPRDTAYLLNQALSALYACRDTGSGIDSCVGNVPVGGRVDTTMVGTKSFTVNAADKAGNTATASVSYRVTFGFCGVSVSARTLIRANSTVPLRLTLCDGRGSPAAGAARLVAASIDGQPVEAPPANPGNVFREVGRSSYLYNLSTKGLAAGPHELIVRVDGDPVDHAVRFSVT